MKKRKAEKDQAVAMEEKQRQHFYKNLLNALWPPPSDEEESTLGTFAAYDAVKYSEGFILKSFHVEGAGELQLPLSAEDAVKLLSVCEQAPFGKGFDTRVNTNVRRCWQVDASKVSFPEMPTFLSDTLQRLAMSAVQQLGVTDGPGVQLEAKLYKLLFYEAGGHFTFHRDTEKEKGMFETLILQLPTEEGYTGGELVVKYHNQVKQFDCHLVSALGYCYTVFFADCMHELPKIASGTKLCLAFNLVKQDSSFGSAHRVLISNRVHKAEAALEPWLQEVTEGKLNVFSGKLAIPLKHKYTKTNLSFARLKGDDRIVAEVLKDSRDKEKKKWLDLHLCLVTKHQEGLGDSSSSDSEDAGHHAMWLVREQETVFEKWIDLDGNPIAVAFENLAIDLEKEVVLGAKGGPFNSKPDEKRYTGYTGNDVPTLEYWYHRAMLVAWPKAISASIACEADVSAALELLNNMLKDSDPHFLGQLRQVILYCRKHAFTVWKAWKGDCSEDPVTPSLLSLCTKVRVLEDVLYILKLLAKDFHGKTPWMHDVVPPKEQILKVGVRNADVAEAIATVVQVFGWEVASADILNLVKECALTRGESCTELAKQLICKGNKDAGALVAHTVFDILESRIAELESNKKPEFTWCQPLAKLPDHPDIESFLKGPQEKYVHRGAESLLAAKSIVERFFHTSREYGSNRNSASDGYSATGTVGEPGRVIVLQKTRRMFQVAMEIWHTEQEETKRLRLELGKARLALPQNELVALTTFSDCSGRGGSKLQRLDTEVSAIKR